jgi:alpha-glucosidase
MMSVATRNALLVRRPGKRTFVITRSTFAGAGKHVGKWLGDNLSLWDHYRISISGILGFASVYQVPMVGADICGFGDNTTEHLCARWATLGAFYPFMRNVGFRSFHLFYVTHLLLDPAQPGFIQSPRILSMGECDTGSSKCHQRSVCLSANLSNSSIDQSPCRYRLLDYLYTSFHQANTDGTPVLQPLWFNYPKDQATYSIDLQFFYGDSILVSPVTDEDATSVTIYLPHDIFYDFNTLTPVCGTGANITLNNVPFTEIPLHIRGGSILPLRAQSAKTTKELRTHDFEFVVAPGTDGTAEGQLYVDDGVSINQPQETQVRMSYKKGLLTVKGEFGFKTGVKASRVRFLGVTGVPTMVEVNSKAVSHGQVSYDGRHQVLDVEVGLDFSMGFEVQIS